MVLKAYKCDHVQPLLQALHWLPVQARTDYKLSAVCYSYFCSSPACFSDLLTVYTPSGQLCSAADTQILCMPHFRTKRLATTVSLSLQCSKVMEFAPFRYLSHSVRNSPELLTIQITILEQVILNSVFLLFSSCTMHWWLSLERGWLPRPCFKPSVFHLTDATLT